MKNKFKCTSNQIISELGEFSFIRYGNKQGMTADISKDNLVESLEAWEQVPQPQKAFKSVMESLSKARKLHDAKIEILHSGNIATDIGLQLAYELLNGTITTQQILGKQS